MQGVAPLQAAGTSPPAAPAWRCTSQGLFLASRDGYLNCVVLSHTFVGRPQVTPETVPVVQTLGKGGTYLEHTTPTIKGGTGSGLPRYVDGEGGTTFPHPTWQAG